MTKAAENIVDAVVAKLIERSMFENAWSSYDAEGQGLVKESLVAVVDSFLPEGIPLTCRDAQDAVAVEEEKKAEEAPVVESTEE